ncbi:O-antigen ligase family protein [Aeromonas caviae]|uniref:O-antigen ligase family protein n=1 Tax=Aeromonas caviae TaxID=648 RepID=UPI001F375042|nr:O-antigen ligase family protein [Aeromonas caviae]UJQ37047.1 O-antigen ligase family protein [Aeromonas caviae]
MYPTISIIPTKRTELLPWLVQLSAFSFGALAIAIPSGYSYGPALLAVISLFVFWRKDYLDCLTKVHKVVAALLFLYFLVFLVSTMLDSRELSQLDRPSRALMAMLTLPLLARHKVKLDVLLFGFGVGAIISACIAIYDKFYLGYERAFDFYSMPIQTGNISMSLGVFCLCGFLWCRAKGERRRSYFYLLGTLAGLTGSFLSGTRGGWILLPLVVMSILFFYRSAISKRDKKWLLLIFTSASVIIFTPQTGVMNRVDEARSDIVKYIDGSERNTSLGIRFQLWRSAWDSFTYKPIFGWGHDGLRESQKQQLEKGQITEFIYNFNYHAHNQYLEDMAKRGLIGLSSLLGILFIPMVLAKSKMEGMPVTSAAFGGLTIVMATGLTTIDYNLSQAYFAHNSGITFFIFSLVLALSVSLGENHHS